tara:strand:+ start:1492 stop:2169 length:678 start_codon:yes stop_codon:yes gene_type:complete
MSKLFKGVDISWKPFIESEFQKSYMQEIKSFLINCSENNEVIYPHPKDIFKSLELTSFQSVKVVILGQDPYHGPNQAHGLAFSVKKNVPIPPSLKNIFKEISEDLQSNKRFSGDLTNWAKQGVLLLNSCLTVFPGRPGSHANLGWQKFTDSIIDAVDKKDNVVFLLWGSYAQKKKDLLLNKNNLVLEAPHPSPLSAHRGFFGCKHFSKANKFLRKNKIKEIDWSS